MFSLTFLHRKTPHKIFFSLLPFFSTQKTWYPIKMNIFLNMHFHYFYIIYHSNVIVFFNKLFLKKINQ